MKSASSDKDLKLPAEVDQGVCFYAFKDTKPFKLVKIVSEVLKPRNSATAKPNHQLNHPSHMCHSRNAVWSLQRRTYGQEFPKVDFYFKTNNMLLRFRWSSG